MKTKPVLTPPCQILKKLAFAIGAAFLFVGFFGLQTSAAAEKLSPYLKVATVDGSIDDLSTNVKTALMEAGFEIIGEYNPMDDSNFKIVAYTRKDLQDTTLQVKDRGLLAAVLKIGFQQTGGKLDITMINPEYLFRGYLMNKYYDHEKALKKVDSDAKNALRTIGSQFKPFGGDLKTKKLKHYHYKIGMEYFDDPVSLKKYGSFEEGLKSIRENLAKNTGGAFDVFSLVREDAEVAVFGIGLGDKETGEAFFLPKIGPTHVAAMPYEIILQGNEATMLHGRFRIAIHWPTLSMVFGKYSFAGIMSTPGDIEKTMKKVSQ